MKDLKPADVAPLYKQKYWDKVSGDQLPAGVDYAVFDTAINSGPGRAVKLLQACVNAEVDGVLGPNSLKAINAFDAETLISDYSKRRLSFLTELSTWDTFGRGWSRRVSEVSNNAEKMIA
jgi:lysozyme family protein